MAHPLIEHWQGLFAFLRRFQYIFNDSDDMMCFTDYAGDNSGRFIISFLLTSPLSSSGFIYKTFDMRQEKNNLKPGSSFEYKKLNKNGDKVRMRMLPDFLLAANEIDGCLVTIDLPNSFEVLSNPGSEDKTLVHSWIEEKTGVLYKPHIAKRVFNLLYFLSIICSVLVTKKTNLIWISDRDAMNKDGLLVDGFGNLSSYFLLSIAKNIKHLTYKYDSSVLNDIDNETIEKDFFSICDLMAGAFNERIVKQSTLSMKPAGQEIIKWAFDNQDEYKLKKVFVQFIEQDGKWYVNPNVRDK